MTKTTKLNENQLNVSYKLAVEILRKEITLSEITKEYVEKYYGTTEPSWSSDDCDSFFEVITFNDEEFAELLKQVEINIEEYYAQIEKHRIANAILNGDEE